MTKREIEATFDKFTKYCVEQLKSSKEELLENFDNGDEIGSDEITDWMYETLSGLIEDIHDVVD